MTHFRGLALRAAIDQERSATQGCLAFPKPDERLALQRRGRNVSGPQDAQRHAQEQNSRGRRWPVSRCRLRRKARSMARCWRAPKVAHAPRDGGMRGRQVAAKMERLQNTLKTLIEIGEAGEIMQNSLVDMQRRVADGLARPDLDQTPVTERTRRQKRAPVRLREGGKRKAKRRIRFAQIALSRAHCWANAESSSMPAQRSRISRSNDESPKVRRHGSGRSHPTRGPPASLLVPARGVPTRGAPASVLLPANVGFHPASYFETGSCKRNFRAAELTTREIEETLRAIDLHADQILAADDATHRKSDRIGPGIRLYVRRYTVVLRTGKTYGRRQHGR